VKIGKDRLERFFKLPQDVRNFTKDLEQYKSGSLGVAVVKTRILPREIPAIHKSLDKTVSTGL
jgi:hypothetical protein